MSGSENVSVDNKNGVEKGVANEKSLSTNCVPNVVTSEPENVVPVPTFVSPVAAVPTSGLDLPSVDPRLMNFLQNLQNNGSIQIHFNFGDVKKWIVLFACSF